MSQAPVAALTLAWRSLAERVLRKSDGAVSIEVMALASAVIAAPEVVVPVPDAFVVSAPAWCAAPAPATGYISQGAARVQWEECILRCCGELLWRLEDEDAAVRDSVAQLRCAHAY